MVSLPYVTHISYGNDTKGVEGAADALEEDLTRLEKWAEKTLAMENVKTYTWDRKTPCDSAGWGLKG